ncbi:MAG: hypothetical protein ACK5DE_09965 [Bacteroidota bacterium]|jgi:hypothetical protein
MTHAINTMKELREATKDFHDDDFVTVEIHEGIRYGDLYTFTINKIDGIQLHDGREVSEIRFCI